MTKSIKLGIIGWVLIASFSSFAQSEIDKTETELITETLMNYIDGTGNGHLDRLRKAFHPDFNLYSVTEEDSLRIWEGRDYISNFKEGKKSNRIGRIISIDFEKDAAVAKAEIEIPGWRIFTDYFLLLKYEGSWKIVHKSYTWKELPKISSVADNQQNVKSAAEQRLVQTGIQEVDEWLKESKKRNDFTVNESSLNAFGYRLLYNSNKPKDAIKVFDLVVELYPESANAYDSAAEGYKEIGNFEKSIEYYRKAIEINGSVQFYQLGYLEGTTYQPTSIPTDATKLFQKEGDWEKDTAFVYVQGGPDLQLNIGPRDGLHLMPNPSNLLKIYPYQSQMLNPEMLASNPILTKEQSAIENAKSVEILDRVIKYLVTNKKKVFLIGHSYGASISMEYVHSKENLTERVVLMGLDLDEDISSWKTMKSGEYIRWKDGTNPYAKTVFEGINSNHPSQPSFHRVADNLGRIVESNMAKKYTELYKDDDFKDIISVHATMDEANGKKSKEEIAILQQKGSVIVEIEGDHHDMLTSEFMAELYEHLVSGKVLKSKY